MGVSVHYEITCNNGVDLPPLPLRPPAVEREREGVGRERERERDGERERERERERD